MKVRSPFFQGEVSSDFKVTGTLREPLALGDARINSGFIQFPFANLEVKQGLVTLASENPYLPTVFVTAGARAFGYELKMQVNGPADVPAIEFSSTPPLTSEEIVLMLTAGQLPRHELTFSTQQKAGTLALFLGKSLWAKFGSDEPGAERLTVRSGEDISDQGRQTYAVEYRLSKNWSLVGEYDRFSALNAGFKWRLYSR
jgi:translocation and assembly module TamB